MGPRILQGLPDVRTKLGLQRRLHAQFLLRRTTVKIKEMLMAQDFDHAANTVTLSTLADKALKIDQRLEQFQAQTKSSGSSSNAGPSGSKSSTSPSAAAPTGTAREKLSVREKVYIRKKWNFH
ncbi:Transposon Tf2-12 polyprotein [Ceratobasidium sp. AG-Ba]|nr:Transposon Tf2-12 polyprotein [Ceratobasidium sp. AG-Ba]